MTEPTLRLMDSEPGAAQAAPLIDLDALVAPIPVKLWGQTVLVRPLNGNEHRQLLTSISSSKMEDKLRLYELAEGLLIDPPAEKRGTLSPAQCGYVLRLGGGTIEQVEGIAREIAAKNGVGPATSPAPQATPPASTQ